MILLNPLRPLVYRWPVMESSFVSYKFRDSDRQVAADVARQGYSCRYRLTQDFQAITEWMTVAPGASFNGIGFPASGIRENVNIEIAVNDGTRALYFSATDPSTIPAELRANEQR
jgi:hypothetical protein